MCKPFTKADSSKCVVKRDANAITKCIKHSNHNNLATRYYLSSSLPLFTVTIENQTTETKPSRENINLRCTQYNRHSKAFPRKAMHWLTQRVYYCAVRIQFFKGQTSPSSTTRPTMLYSKRATFHVFPPSDTPDTLFYPQPGGKGGCTGLNRWMCFTYTCGNSTPNPGLRSAMGWGPVLLASNHYHTKPKAHNAKGRCERMKKRQKKYVETRTKSMQRWFRRWDGYCCCISSWFCSCRFNATVTLTLSEIL